MKIQQIETLSGLDRATIRYYEKEGLLNPHRTENGYRDYSDTDLEEVKRIRLFRQLEMPLDQIRQLQQGIDALTPALSRQLRLLEDQAQTHRTAKEVCSKILAGERCYGEINADTYLQMLQNPEPPKPSDPPQKPQTYREILHLDHHPGRRFFARMMDLVLLHCLLVLLVVVGLRVRTNLKFWLWFITAGVVWLMIPLEALMLWIFGTTPGKLYFGIKLKYYYGKRFTFAAAIRRSWLVFRYGLVFNVPFYNQYRLCKCYYECDEYPDMKWDDETDVTYQKWSKTNPFSLCCFIMLIGLLYNIWYSDCLLPKHREDLTIAQFAENYNFYAEYLEVPYRLNSDGTWVDDQDTEGDKQTDFTYTLENGIITAIHLDAEIRGFTTMVPYADYQTTAMIALSAARLYDTNRVLDRIDYWTCSLRYSMGNSIQDFDYSIRVDWEMEYKNCHATRAWLVADNDPRPWNNKTNAYAHITLTIECM